MGKVRLNEVTMPDKQLTARECWINDMHPLYGKCVAAGCKDGEVYRMFLKRGVTSLIPCENKEIEQCQT